MASVFFRPVTFHRASPVNQSNARKRSFVVTCDFTCKATPLGSRREFAILGLQALIFPACATAADNGGAFSKYIKRKKLDPLDTYVPPVLLTQSQIQSLEEKLLAQNPDFSDSRSFLRSGPASSLRSNIRAVAQYASESGDGKVANQAVDQCIGSIEELDTLLFRASRNDTSASIQKMKEKIEAAVSALDRLLSTVPTPILEKCKAVVASYEESVSTPPPPPSPEKADKDEQLLEILL